MYAKISPVLSFNLRYSDKTFVGISHLPVRAACPSHIPSYERRNNRLVKKQLLSFEQNELFLPRKICHGMSLYVEEFHPAITTLVPMKPVSRSCFKATPKGLLTSNPPLGPQHCRQLDDSPPHEFQPKGGYHTERLPHRTAFFTAPC
jgi:hypothetical protein